MAKTVNKRRSTGKSGKKSTRKRGGKSTVKKGGDINDDDDFDDDGEVGISPFLILGGIVAISFTLAFKGD